MAFPGYERVASFDTAAEAEVVRVVGLSFSAIGALALFFQPRARETGQALLIVGALLAALAGSVQRIQRSRRRDESPRRSRFTRRS